MFDKSEATERLLDRTSFEWTSGQREENTQPTLPSTKSGSIFHIAVFFLLFYIAAIETVQTIRGSRSRNEIKGSGLPYSPANVALQYKNQLIWQDGQHSPFTQQPSPALDALWDDLLTAQNIRVTAEELGPQNENLTSRVQLADGDYLGVISVWHDLHCLDIMRRGLRSDYYGSRIKPEEEGLFTPGHYDHCIERIRQTVMCHADLGIFVPEWVGDSHAAESKILRSNAQSQCVDWVALDTWARKRALKKRGFKLRAGPFEQGFTQ